MLPVFEHRIGEFGKLTTTLVIPSISYSVYYLQSCVSSKTYVGYSIDPFHRLDQHNHFITGGAKKTNIGGPWKIICIVSGFPTSTSALQFEWRWNEIRKRRIRRGRKTYKGLGIIECNAGLQYLFACQWTSTSPTLKSFPLYVWWNYFNPCPPRISANSVKYRCSPQLQEYPGWDIYFGYFYGNFCIFY